MDKTIIIIGGGFAGVNLALSIAGNKNYRVIVVDRNNYNYFTPLIYQLATGFLDTSNVIYPFRKLFRGKENISFRMGEFRRVDPDSHTCYLDNGELVYDYLVLAAGATTNYFGSENIKSKSIPLKSINDALQMRNTLLQILEKASRTTDPCERKELLTIVIAGGGPTGVEVSGMLAELRRHVLAKDYPELKDSGGEIFLLDGTPEVLMQMSAKSRKEIHQTLTKLGVRIRLNCLVKDFNGEKVILENDETIETRSLIWTAGVIATAFDGIPSSCIGTGRRMITDQYNKVKGLDDIYAIGDTCIMEGDPGFNKGHPQLAQPAIQQGNTLGKNFRRMHEGKPLIPFRYHDKGTLAIAGRNRAVADLFPSKYHVRGFPALFIWLFVHLMGLISWRNKMKTLYNWVAAYLTRDQSLRIIVRPSEIQSNQTN